MLTLDVRKSCLSSELSTVLQGLQVGLLCLPVVIGPAAVRAGYTGLTANPHQPSKSPCTYNFGVYEQRPIFNVTIQMNLENKKEISLKNATSPIEVKTLLNSSYDSVTAWMSP